MSKTNKKTTPLPTFYFIIIIIFLNLMPQVFPLKKHAHHHKHKHISFHDQSKRSGKIPETTTNKPVTTTTNRATTTNKPATTTTLTTTTHAKTLVSTTTLSSTPTNDLNTPYYTATTATTSSYPPYSSPPFFTTKTKKLPQAIIVGVKKGGTRALLEFLNVHPQVEICKKESHFFDTFYSMGVDWYRNSMPLTSRKQLTLEKTPAYFITSSAPARIRKTIPNAKLIFILRNPVTRVISDFVQLQARKPSNQSFQQLAFIQPKIKSSNTDTTTNIITDTTSDKYSSSSSLGEKISRKNKLETKDAKKLNENKNPSVIIHNSLFPSLPSLSSSTDTSSFLSSSSLLSSSSSSSSLSSLLYMAEEGKLKVDKTWTPIKISLYHKHINNWLKHFNPRQMLFIDGDLFIRQPYKALKNVEEFLGLKSFYRKRHFFRSEKKGFPCMLLKPVDTLAGAEWLREAVDETMYFTGNYSILTGNVSESVGGEIDGGSGANSDVSMSLSGGGGIYGSNETERLKIKRKKMGEKQNGEKFKNEKGIFSKNDETPKKQQPSLQQPSSLSTIKKHLNSTNRIRCLGKNKGRQHPSIHPTLLKTLYDFFEPYNQQLFELIGEEFEWTL